MANVLRGTKLAKAALAKANREIKVIEVSVGLLRVTTKSSNYTIGPTDSVILVDASSSDKSITMPVPTYDNGSRRFSISKIDSSNNSVFILPNGSETIAGGSGIELTRQNEVINLITDGTNWYLGA